MQYWQDTYSFTIRRHIYFVAFVDYVSKLYFKISVAIYPAGVSLPWR